MDLITVIINVYNGEKYIKKCLDSVINQTYQNLEILIINDGSTDNTLDIINKYKDARINIINQENKGLSLSRNVGIDNAKGEYLYFVDADDFIENDTIEYLYNLCKKNRVLMSTCLCKQITKYDTIIKNKPEIIRIESGKNLLDNILLSKTRSGALWNKLIKKELFDNIRFEDRIINDVVVVYKLALKLDKYVCSNQIKYICFRHSDSIMSTHKPEWDIDLYKASFGRYNDIKKIYPDYLENDFCLAFVIMVLYEHDNSRVNIFLKKENAIKIFKKHFKFKMLFFNINYKNKIKLILCRINPSLLQIFIKLYLKIKGLFK